MIKFSAPALGAVLVALAALPAQASPIAVTFDFGALAPNGYSAPTNLVTYANGASLTFTNSSGGSVPASITAWSMTIVPSVATALTQAPTSVEGADESGLGVQSASGDTGTTREVNKNEVVALDFSNVLANGGSIVSVLIGSLQTGEGFAVYSSSTKVTQYTNLSQLGTLVQTDYDGDGTVTATTYNLSLASFQNPYVYITGYQTAPDNVGDLAVGTAVVNLPQAVLPEPASFALLGAGLAGLPLLRRRKPATR